MPNTKLLYLEDSYQKLSSAKITSIKTVGKQTHIVLNQTIFYPQGGGQLSDKGSITGKSGALKVTHTSFKEGLVIHQGKLTGSLKKNHQVDLSINWKLRYLHMQSHTAGHILDEAVKDVIPEYHGIEGQHGIGKQFYIKFKGFIDQSHQTNIQQQINSILTEDLPIKTRLVSKKQLESENIHLPFKLPNKKQLRLLTIGDRLPVPDGGTQLNHTGEAWPINITHFEYQNGHTLIHYQVTPQDQKDTPTRETVSPPKTIIQTPTSETTTLKSFSQKIDNIFEVFKQQSPDEATRIEFLGKKGKINHLSRSIPQLSTTDRTSAGKLLNQLKADITTEIMSKSQKSTTSTEKQWLDVTAPGKTPPLGHLHPITGAINDIQHIFEGIGFTRVRYPEVDWDYYVFESLNMPTDHPARDEWETFFIDTPKNPKRGQMVLTTHTSNGQVREMERVKKPPIRMLNIAKCYRRQQDVTHTAMFHQFEGLVIDKNISIQHLKGTLDYFAKKFYGPKAKSRIRPFMFKFTEPSFEVDFSCVHCSGSGCRFCKSGWHEVGGAGMVHPNVLKFGGVDPEVYSGFAFGWGIERVYTLKPGLELDDIRPLYSKHLDFLDQF